MSELEKYNISNTPKVPLTELIEHIVDNRGKTVPTTTHGIKLIATNCIRNEYLYPLYEKVRYVSTDVYDTWFRSHPVPGDIIFVNKGTPGRTALVPDPIDFCIAQDMMAFHVNSNKVYNKYLLAVMRSVEVQQFIYNNHVGTLIPHFKKEQLRTIMIPLPEMKVQKRIGDFYFNLSDKIENNNRINRNLEAQAQALFKSWFVDFEPFGGKMPDDWKEVSLNEMTSKFGTGLNPRKNFKLGEGENYYVTIKNMGNNRVYLDDRCDKVTDEAIEKINKRSKLQAGDLLFSGIGTIGRVALVTETPINWNTSESVFNLHPANNISSEFLYVLLLSDVFQNYVKVHAQGGVQQGIRMASLKDYKMYIPEDSKMKQFDSLIIPIITRIKNIDKENDRLAALRDTLLPKLMKGEIEV